MNSFGMFSTMLFTFIRMHILHSLECMFCIGRPNLFGICTCSIFCIHWSQCIFCIDRPNLFGKCTCSTFCIHWSQYFAYIALPDQSSVDILRAFIWNMQNILHFFVAYFACSALKLVNTLSLLQCTDQNSAEVEEIWNMQYNTALFPSYLQFCKFCFAYFANFVLIFFL